MPFRKPPNPPRFTRCPKCRGELLPTGPLVNQGKAETFECKPCKTSWNRTFLLGFWTGYSEVGKDDFTKGYVCAVTCYLQGHGSGVGDTIAKDMLGGIGRFDMTKIDAHDREVLERFGFGKKKS